MLGFLPGFPIWAAFLRCWTCRALASPRKMVPARSGRYSRAHVRRLSVESLAAGACSDVRRPLFDATNVRRPGLMAPGDQVVWKPSTGQPTIELDAECAAGHFDLAD